MGRRISWAKLFSCFGTKAKSSCSWDNSWANLHQPLLGLILDRLPVPDYLRFGAVCRSWRHVQKDNPQRLKIPYMILQKNKTTLYSLFEQRYYPLSLPLYPNIGDKVFCGSSHGWLLFMGTVGRVLPGTTIYKYPMTLLNPFSWRGIDIPVLISGLSSMSCMFTGTEPYGALSTAPTDPDYFVLLCETSTRRCILIRGRDEVCRMFTLPAEGVFHMPVICKGKVYIKTRRQGMDRREGKESMLDLIILDPWGFPESAYLQMDWESPLTESSTNLLVESDGEILVVRFIRDTSRCGLRYEVFKADLSRKLWVRMECLGDRMLFLTKQGSFSLSAGCTGGRGNCIYNTWTLDWQSIFVYDYGSHQLLGSGLQNLKEVTGDFPGHPDFKIIEWIVPSL